LSVAEEVVTFVAGLVMTTGGPVAVRVVKVLSPPKLVLPVTGYDSEMVLAVKLLMLALTFRNVFPV
jgi:hypothetical protein